MLVSQEGGSGLVRVKATVLEVHGNVTRRMVEGRRKVEGVVGCMAMQGGNIHGGLVGAVWAFNGGSWQ